MNINLEWFKRHPNWTYIIGFIGYQILSFCVGIIVGLVAYPNEVNDSAITIVTLLMFVIIVLPFNIVILKLKKRNVWWILLMWLLAPLLLENRNEYSDYATKDAHWNEFKSWQTNYQNEDSKKQDIDKQWHDFDVWKVNQK
jgi:hypothetical protein